MLRIAILALGTFAIGTDAFVIAGILPDISRGLAVPVSTAGILVTAFALAYAVSAPLLATITGNVPFRRVLPLTMAALAAGNLAAALAPSFGTLLVARIFAALAAGVYTPAASSMAALMAPVEKRGRALATVFAGLTVANVLGVPLGTWIGAQSWRMTFLAVACLSAVVAVLLAVGVPKVERPRAASLGVRLGLLGRRDISGALAFTFFIMLGAWLVFTFVSPMLQSITHVGAAAVSMFLLCAGIGGMIGTYAGGQLTDRWGPLPTLIIGGSLLVLVFLAFHGMLASVAGAAAGVGLSWVGGTMTAPAQQHRLVGLAPEAPALALSLNSSAIYFGAGAGSALGSLLVRTSGLGALAPVSAVCALLALSTLLLGVRIPRSQPAE